MTKLGPREIEERLTPPPAPPPPEGLAEKIKAEIPDSVPATPPAPRRRGWLIAATLVVGVGAALLVYRTGSEVPLAPETVRERGEAREQARTDPAPPDPRSTPGASDGGRAAESLAKSEPPDREAETESTTASVAEQDRVAPSVPKPAPTAQAPAPPPIDASADSPAPSSPGDRGRPADEAEKARQEGARAEETRRLNEAAEPRARARKVTIPDATPHEPGAAETSRGARPDKGPSRQGARVSGVDLEKSPTLRDGGATLAATVEPEPAPPAPPPSTGGTAEPNDQRYRDLFFDGYGTHPFLDTEDDPLSTFGLDVDTASYTVVRRFLQEGHLPPPDAVRVEEMINYFDYGDPAPKRGDFRITAQAGPAPFAEGPRYRLLRFHIQAREIAVEDRKPATLIFVVDVSGSMSRENRLGLVQRSLTLLLDQLRPDDRVGLVVYGSSGRVLLEPTGDLEAIRSAIARLEAGGSTNAEEGLVLAYDLARRDFREGTLHRLILCSDGVANVGRTGPRSILERIDREGRAGIELTTVGFGMGNYNDVLMEQLADRGNGRYAYVDDLDEARRIFVENLTGTLQTIASDAKVQVAFDPATVSRYRLLGYENRDIADERFRDDTVDAGEIGAGHGVTALYEIKLAEGVAKRAPLATLTLRYRSQEAGEVVEQELRVRSHEIADSWERAPRELQLAAVVAELGEILRRSYWAREGDLDDLFRRAQRLAARYEGDLAVAELAALVGRAARLNDDRR